MKALSKTLWGVGIAALALASPGQATVIDFDSAPQYTCGAQVQAGLVFESTFCLGVWPSNPVSTNGTPGLIYGYGPMTIKQFDDGEFTLNSFLAGISWYSAQTSFQIDYVFDLFGGGTSIGSFVIGQGFQSYVFNADIVKATFTGLPDGYVAIDNLEADFVAAPGVPEPASWALMISGFGLAGAAMRRSARQRTLVRA